MKKSMIFFVMLFFGHVTMNAQWKYANFPYGGAVMCTATHGNTIFAGTAGALFLSTDQGKNWKAANGMDKLAVYCMAVYGNEVYVGSDKGIFVSADDGIQWTYLTSPTEIITAITVDASFIYAGTLDLGLLRSPDKGNTWEDLGMNLPFFCVVQKVLLAGSTIIVGTGYQSVYVSRNNGASWAIASNGMSGSAYVNSLVRNGSEFFCISNDSVYYTPDTCVHWLPLQMPGGARASCLYFKDNSLLMGAGNAPKVYRTDDHGVSWIPLVTGLPKGSGIADLVANTTGIYAATYSGMYTSADAGENWNEINNGISNMGVSALFSDNNIMLAGTSGNGAFISKDKGANWLRVTDIPKYELIDDFLNTGTVLFAATGDGMFLSTNNGDNWKAANNGLPPYSRIDKLTVNGNTVFASTIDGIYTSTDNGANWIAANTGLPTSSTFSAFLSKGNYVIAATLDALFKTTDNGANWVKLNGKPGTYVYSFNVVGNTLFAAADNGMSISIDDGETWMLIDTGTPTNTGFYSTITAGNKLFAGSYQDMVMSTDNGTSWETVTENLPTTYAMSLTVNNNNLFVGTGGRGLWYRPLSELVGITENKHADFHLFPNPSNGVLTLSLLDNAFGKNTQVEILDVTGQSVYTSTMLTTPIDLSNQAKGIYFVRLISNDGKSSSQKIILQ